jgi:hypothetical protein
MNLAKQSPPRFGRLKARSFFLLALLAAGILFFLSRQPDVLSPFFANCTRSLGLSFAKLKPQGLTNRLSAVLDGIRLWGQGVYAAGIEQSHWLINRWLVLAVVMGTLIPSIVLGLFFIVKGIRSCFEKNAIANKYLSEVVKSIKSKVSRAYRRSVLRNWGQASLVILSLGISLLCLQLLAANLWRWDKGIGISSLFWFILYAHWVYYDRLLRQDDIKKRLLDQIDSRLGLKQGLVTLMDTRNFNTSPRFYKLLLSEVFYKVRPANLADILPHKFSWSAKRDLVIPLLLIISLSGLASAAYSRLAVSPRIKDKLEHFFFLEDEPETIEQLLAQEADSLRVLTTELQRDLADEPEVAYIIDNLNELTAEFTYLAGAPLDISQNNRAWDSQETEAGQPSKPSEKRQAINWDKDTADRKSKKSKKLSAPDIEQKVPLATPLDWPEVLPPDAGTTNPLRANDRYYQIISTEVNKLAQAMLAMKPDREKKNILDKEDEQQLTLEKELPEALPLADQSADAPEGLDTESPQSNTGNKELRNNKSDTGRELGNDKSDTNRKQDNPQEPKDSPTAENPTDKAPTLQPIVSALEQIGNKLSTIKLYDAGVERNNQRQTKTRPPVQSPQGEAVNRIRLKPIKPKAKREPAATPEGTVTLEHPHHLEIDFNAAGSSSATVGKNQRFPLPQPPPGSLERKIKVSARRIEELGNRLLLVNNPEHISFSSKKGEAISSIWERARASIKTPRNIDNQLSQLTERIQGVEDPRQIAAVTSELAELMRNFSAWGSDSGNKLLRRRPDLAQLTETDSLGRKVSTPLPEGGPDRADRQAVIIRGKREQASQQSGNLERIRVEEHPRHLPTHDITANVSVELTQVANRLENIDVASIKANMNGKNLREFVIEKQRTLEILSAQLARAKDFSSITKVTNKLADLSAQLGKLALDSRASAEFLANQQARPEGRWLGQDSAQRELMERVSQDGRQLLELSRQIKQEVSNRSRKDIASQMLTLAKGLAEADFDQLILNDHNKLQLDNLLRNLSQQLRKVEQNTTDLADVDRNSYAVAAIASRLERLGRGGIDFTGTAEGRNRVNLTQLAHQLSGLSRQMQTSVQTTTPSQLNQPQSGKDQELLQAIADGRKRLAQISERLESAENREERKELGLELLELSRRLKEKVTDDDNDSLKAVSTKAIMSLGDQVKLVGRQLRLNPTDYQPISQRLQQIADRLEERQQELTAAQLASNQDIARLSSDLSSLAQSLAKMETNSPKQQEPTEKQTAKQIKTDLYQLLANQNIQDLLKETLSSSLAQSLAKMETISPKQQEPTGKQTAKQIKTDLYQQLANQNIQDLLKETLSSSLAQNLAKMETNSLKQQEPTEKQTAKQIKTDLYQLLANQKIQDLLKETLSSSLTQSIAKMETNSLKQQEPTGKQTGKQIKTDLYQLLANQNIQNLLKETLSSSLAQNLAKMETISPKQQKPTEKQTAKQIKTDLYQQLATQAAQSLFKISQDLADLSDSPAGEYTDKLGSMIEKLKLNDGSKQLDQSAIEELQQELFQLSRGLAQSRLEPENMATAGELPEIAGRLAELSQGLTDKPLDSRQLASQLTEIYAELNQLDLAGQADESARAKDLGDKLKQISNSIKNLPLANREEITSALDRLGEELSTADMPVNETAYYRRLRAEQNDALAELTAAARRKKEIALKNIDRVVERLKRQHRDAETRYNPDRNLKRLNLAAKGIAGANKGIMGKLKNSPYNRTNFAADKVAKQIDVTPEKETISNVYPMEHNLTERNVFSRIIKRLENKRERISHFGTSSSTESTASRRTGSFNQPQNLDYEGRMLTMTEREPAPAAIIQEKKTAFLEKPMSYNQVKESTPYTYQSPLSPKDIDETKLSALPLEKQAPKQKIQPNLKLHAEQTQDNASQGQLIPTSYREIIRKLYLR